MGESGEAALARVASVQLGVVTAKDCARHGMPRRAVARRVATGEWLRLFRGVYRLGAHPATLQEREVAALRAAGDGAALSHQSAARHLGLSAPECPAIQIIVPEARRISTLEGVQVWRSRSLSPEDVARHRFLRLTRVGRTVLDLASVLEDDWLRASLDSALRLRPSNLMWIRRALERHGRGRTGAERLRVLLGEYVEGAEVADSVLESFAVELGSSAPRKPVLHHRIRDGRRFVAEVDLAWPAVRLCIELDGWRHHGNLAAFGRDRARDRALVELGWTVLRYTWQDVSIDRQQVLDQMLRAYDACAIRSGLRRVSADMER